MYITLLKNAALQCIYFTFANPQIPPCNMGAGKLLQYFEIFLSWASTFDEIAFQAGIWLYVMFEK